MFDLPFDLPDGWILKTVEQLIEEKIIEKPLDGNHGGIHPKSSDYVDHGVPFVMASDLEAGQVSLKECKFISEKQAKSLRKGFSIAGDVLISHKATIGRTAIVQESEHEFIMLTPQVTYYRIRDHRKLNNVYLKSYFDSPFFQNILNLWAGAGSTRAYLGITGQLKLPIIIPTIDSQISISNQVACINEKITLNRQINQTLEQIAQAIFKSWFVDFEPTRAKMAAKEAGRARQGGERSAAQGDAERPDGRWPEAVARAIATGDPERAAMAALSGAVLASDPIAAGTAPDTTQPAKTLEQLSPKQRAQLKALAALFPDTLVESELGEVPAGWEVGPLSDLAKLVTKSVKPHEQPDVQWEHYSIPAFDTDGLPALEYGHTIKSGKYKVDPNAILSSKLNPHFPRTWWPEIENADAAVCSTEFMQFVPSKLESRSFVFGLIVSEPFQEGIMQRVTGSTGSRQRAQPKQVAQMAVISPPQKVISEYCSIADPIEQKRGRNLKEIRTLSLIRDTLLPKLLSGELSVSALEETP